MNSDMIELYLQRQSAFEKELNQAQRYSSSVSLLRLLFFLLAAGALIYGLTASYNRLLVVALLFTAVFFWLIIEHLRLKREIDFLQKLVKINIRAQLRLQGQWTDFTERGEGYSGENHPYAGDLNIFGQGSLFQYINATSSFRGERLLAEQLSRSAPAEEIKLRQEAVRELAKELDFRQKFQAAGMDEFFKSQDPAGVLQWAESTVTPMGRKTVLLYLPLITLTMLTLAISGLLSYLPAVVLLTVQVLAALPGEKGSLARFSETDQAVRRLKRYTALMQRIEEKKFKSPLLTAQRELLFPAGQPASRHIAKLVSISDRNNLRFGNSLIYLILKYTVLWDLWTLKMLDDWQKSWGKEVRRWFDATAEIEALSSLGGLSHDNPAWVFPKVEGGAAPALTVQELGHPLIPSGGRVANDTALTGPGRFFIITGSNMSGKSTFLRSVGVNLVLAYTGAPVCAAEFACSVMQIYTKMHIYDNLEKGVSTFYGELLRMKMIMEAAKNEAPLIILLDEIFRGTNPKDRIFATGNIIGQLLKKNVIGLVTTHDLELGELEKEYAGAISNYHFTDEIRDGEIYFDYKIKPGISQTANAVALMKLVGIEVEAK